MQKVLRWTRATTVLCALLCSSAATAQFTTLDRQQVTTHAGMNFGVVVIDRPDSDLDSVARADFYAELGFVDFSIYSALPVMATLSGSPSEVTIGNLEVGGAHRWSAGGPVSVVSHAGLVFPTASASARKAAVAASGSSGQVGDFYVSSLPELWAVRLATSPRADFGAFFMQGDVGFDFLFPKHASDEVGMRTSIGAGVTVALATLTLEIANAGLITESDAFDQTLSVGVDLNMLLLQPRITYTTGLGDEMGDDYTLTVGVGIGF